MDFGTSEFAARSLTLSDDAVRQELKKLNLNANIYQLEKRRCCKRFYLEAESLPAVLFYRIMGHDWDRTAAQFEKARGRIRVRKQPASAEAAAQCRLQKRRANMSRMTVEAYASQKAQTAPPPAAAPAAAPAAGGATSSILAAE